MSSPKTPHPHKRTLVLGAPKKDPANRQDARIAILESQIQELIKENALLKQRLCRLEEDKETRSRALFDKAEEVKASFAETVKAVKKEMHETTHKKMDVKIQSVLQENRLQESNSLKVRVGGLDPQWWSQVDSFDESLAKFKDAIKPVHIEEGTIAFIDSNKTAPHKQGILTFKNKEERLKLLRQSHLLKGTTLWIAEELTPNQLKLKSSELKKMHEARRQGKWAVYRGGKAIIQEFRTPKVATPPPEPP